MYSECPGTLPPQAPDNRTWWVACINNKTANSSLYTAYSWIRQSVVIFIPAFVLILLNSLTVREFIRVRKMQEQWNGRQESSVQSPRQPRDDNLVRLLMVVTISFFITLVPAGVSNAIYTQIYSTEKDFEIFMAVTNDLEMLNHTMNFYLYVLCSKPIREAIKSVCSRQYARFTSSLERLRTSIKRKPSIKDVNPGSSSVPTVNTIDLAVSQRYTNDERNKVNRNDREKSLSAITLSSDVASDKTSHADPAEENGNVSHSPR